MRVMDAVPAKGKAPGYPKGYIKYENGASPKPQGVDPTSGKTLPNNQSHSHLIKISMNLFKCVEGLKVQSLFIDVESLTISFEPYRIVIYNSYIISKPEGLVGIPNSILDELAVEEEIAKFIFSNGCIWGGLVKQERIG